MRATGTIYFFLMTSLASAGVLRETDLTSMIAKMNETAFSHLEKDREVSSYSSSCKICRGFMEGFKVLFDFPVTLDCTAALIDYVCQNLKIEDPFVCKGITSVYKDEILYVVNRLIFDPKQICGLAIKGCGDPLNPLSQGWNVKIPGNKPAVEPWTLPQQGSPTLRVLQLSDIHYDSFYTPGAEADCSEPLCCRAHDGLQNVQSAAGKYGTVGKCDIPKTTFEKLLQHLQSEVNFDYIMWTGDLPPHNIWNQSKTDQVHILEELTRLFGEYFPGKVIFPAVGNHESAPADNFPSHIFPEKYGTAWLYNALEKQWKSWLPNFDISATVQYRASYAVKPFPGLRLISLNTQYGDAVNFWMYLNSTDPDGTMSWLVEQLTEAENAGEKVHIIGHMPPIRLDVLTDWSRNYYSVVNRFENTIRAQFFGHTHNDHFSIFYDTQKAGGRPTANTYISPSVTTFSHLLPSFRVYTIDGNYPGSSFQVLDTETYMLDLELANSYGGFLSWNLEYTAKSAYGLKSLFPKDWNSLIQRFINNDTLFQEYYRYYNHNPKVGYCECPCKFERICEILSSKSYSPQDFCSNLDPCPSKSKIPSSDSKNSIQGKSNLQSAAGKSSYSLETNRSYGKNVEHNKSKDSLKLLLNGLRKTEVKKTVGTSAGETILDILSACLKFH